MRFSKVLLFIAVFISVAAAAPSERPAWRVVLDQAETHANHLRLDSAVACTDRASGLAAGDTAVMATILDRKAFFRFMAGRYSEADSLTRVALYLRERVLGPNHPAVATVLNNLGYYYTKLGRLAEADTLIQRSLRIYASALADSVTAESVSVANYASTMGNLGTVRAEQRKLDDAYRLFSRAVTILQEVYGSEHVRLSTWLSNLGSLAHEMGDLRAAESLYVEATRRLPKRAASLGHPKYVLQQYSLAEVFRDQGRYDTALGVVRSGLAAVELAFDGNHWLVAYGLDALGRINELGGRYHEALVYYDSALAVVDRLYGSSHAEAATVLEDKARVLAASDSGRAASEAAVQAVSIRLRDFESNNVVMSEATALGYSRLVRRAADTYLSTLVREQRSLQQCPEGSGDIILNSSGIVWDAVSKRHLSRGSGLSGQAAVAFQEWRDAKQRLSLLYFGGPDDYSTGDEYVSEIDSLTRAVDSLETQLVLKGLASSSVKPLRLTSPTELAQVLPEDAVLLNYIKYASPALPGRASREYHYACWVLEGDGKQWLAYLGEARVIDSLVIRYQSHMRRMSELGHPPVREDERECAAICWSLREMLIDPVMQVGTQHEQLYIVPDGSVCMVSFSGLPDTGGAFLVERFEIRYLMAGRDLLRSREQVFASDRLVAFGNPRFEYVLDESAEGAVEEEGELALDEWTAVSRGHSGDWETIRDWQMSPLPLSKAEVEAAARAWRGAGHGAAELFTEGEATEENFKLHGPGARIIHVATHGFFLGGDDTTTAEVKDLLSPFGGESPLLRSGLVFSDVGSQAGRRGTGCEDGMLSAEEVSALDLTGTQAVVLSACETALGRIKAGEGIFGLRRAFLLAGAAEVIGTLWPIGDEISSLLLRGLYEQGFSNSSDELRTAQIALISRLRDSGFAAHPYLWAGYIVIGRGQ